MYHYSLYSLTNHLVLVYILATQLFIRYVSSLNLTNAYLNHKCFVDQGTYKPGSQFEKDLNEAIKSVSTTKLMRGYVAISSSGEKKAITIVLQCRGDTDDPKCRTCYSNAIAELRKRCPLNKAGMIWYDQCYLDFGTLYFPDFLPIDYENSFSMHNPNNVGGDTKLFNKNMKDLFNELKIKASKNVKANEIIGYAAGEKRFGAKKLYGMVQCAQDVECKLCLESCMRELSNCCDGNYKTGSAYEKELNSAIKTVCTSNLQRGTTTISSGESKTFSTVTIQCRGDSYGDKCRSCCVTAIDVFRKRCPTSKAALIWYDQCYLDVGTIPYPLIKNKIDYENTFSMHNPNNVNGNLQLFNKNTRDFFNELTAKAIIRDGVRFVNYAAGEKSFGTRKLYAIVQCGQIAECKVCLESSIKELSKCCNGKQGARVFVGRSCNLRYELYPFLRT